MPVIRSDDVGLIDDGMLDSHLVSASDAGPVEIGFRKVTFESLQSFFVPVQSNVEKMVFPTSVLAPNIWYARCERQSSEVMGAISIAGHLTHRDEQNKIVGSLRGIPCVE